MTQKLLGAAAATLMLAAAASAHAQTRKSTSRAATPGASAAAVSPLQQGPSIPGLCVYSESQVIGTSSVGKSYATRMQQLQAQAAAEISGQQTQIQAEEKALVAKRATLSQEQFAQQAQPLQTREQALNQTAESRTRDLRYTAATQQQRLATAIEPLVRSAYESHHCSILIGGDNAVLAANRDMDLTIEVRDALNQRMSTITFDRESAPAQ